jgi:uncharacterized membrane protein
MATTPASVDRHPLHPILVAFPIGLWMFSLVCDLMYRFGGEAIWSMLAWYTIVAGVIGAVVAAVPGVVDFFSITDPRAGRIGLAHLAINVVLICLFSANAWIRTLVAPGSPLTFVLSIVGVSALVVSGWLGGEMVYVHKVGVAQGEVASRVKRSKRAA